MESLLNRLMLLRQDMESKEESMTRARTRALTLVALILGTVAACVIGYVVYTTMVAPQSPQVIGGDQLKKMIKPDLYVCSGGGNSEGLKRAKRQQQLRIQTSQGAATLIKRVPRPLSLPPPSHNLNLNFSYNPPLYHDVAARCAWGHLTNRRVPHLEDVGVAYDFQQLEARSCENPEECKNLCLQMHKTDDPYLCNYFTWHRQKKLALFYFLEPTLKWNLTEDNRVETFFWQCKEVQCAWWWRPHRVWTHLSDLTTPQLRKAPGLIATTQCADFASCQFSCETRPSYKELPQLPEGAQPDDPSCSYVVMPSKGTQNRESFLFTMPQSELKNVSYRGSSSYDSFELICDDPHSTQFPTFGTTPAAVAIGQVPTGSPPAQPPPSPPPPSPAQIPQGSSLPPPPPPAQPVQPIAQPQGTLPPPPPPQGQPQGTPPPAQPVQPQAQPQGTLPPPPSPQGTLPPPPPPPAQPQGTLPPPPPPQAQPQGTQPPPPSPQANQTIAQTPPQVLPSSSTLPPPPPSSPQATTAANSSLEREKRETNINLDEIQLRECLVRGEQIDCSRLRVIDPMHPSECVQLNSELISENPTTIVLQSKRPVWLVMQHQASLDEFEQSLELTPGLKHTVDVLPQKFDSSSQSPEKNGLCGPPHLRHRRCTASCQDRSAVDVCGCTLIPPAPGASDLLSVPICDEQKIRQCVHPHMERASDTYFQCMKECKSECDSPLKPFAFRNKASTLGEESDVIRMDLSFLTGESINSRPIIEMDQEKFAYIWVPLMILAALFAVSLLSWCIKRMI